MGITGRSLAGAGLQGLGEGLQQWSAQTIKRKQIEDEWAFELKKQRLAQEDRQQAAQTLGQQHLIENIIKDPATAAAYIAAAKVDPAMKGMPIEPIQQLARTVGPRLISQQLLTAPTTEAMGADLGRRFSNATGEDYGSLPLQPAFDLQKFGGEQPDRAIQPDLQSALSDALTRSAQLRAAEDEKMARLGETKRVEAFGTGTGTAAAKHEAAPTALADDIAAITGKGPAEADVAGQKRLAENLANVDPRFVTLNQTKITGDELAKLTPSVINASARKTGAETGAREAAQAPYKTPTILYSAETGEPTPIAVGPGPHGGQVISVVPGMPPGLSKAAPRKLTTSEIDKVSSLNNSEVEAVKVLKLLHDTGADQSKSLSDPRWRNFVMTSLQAMPGDPKLADITQRTQAVRAILLRQLMGGRPSEYIAKIIEPHLPDATMTGELLYHNLQNVMQQVGQYRTEIEGLSGQRPGKLGPISGMSYQQYLDSLNTPTAPVVKGSTLNDLLKPQ